MYSLNLNYADFIKISCADAIRSCTFLVDTQADISLIKISYINPNITINDSEIINITGITPNAISTLGTICTNLIISNQLIRQVFHIVSDDFHIPASGILGKDFLKDNKCKLDYENMTISVLAENTRLKIPIQHGTNNFTCIIPPRCEVFRIFNISNVSEPMYVESQEICKGVFIGKGIIDSNNPILRIVNITDEFKCVRTDKIKTEKLKNFYIYSVNESRIDDERIVKLRSILETQMPDDVRSQLMPICEQYADIFSLKDDKMTVNNFYEQSFRLTDSSPVYIKNYRLPHTQREEINRQVQNLLDNNLIEASSSNFNSPLILVPKKSSDDQKKYRMCVDYRAVNRKLIADKFPLPRIDDILDNLGRAKHFSIIDLFSGFHQIPLQQDSRDITAFSTDKGSFRWKVLPFGLNVAPNSFSRMMSIAFSGLMPNKAFLYVDDIIIVGCSKQHHLNNLKDVFEILRKHNLKINPYKCNFFRSEVTFLGHKCTANGLLPDDSKINAIKNYPIPSDKDAVRRFVAFANYYRRFIPNFAILASPLNRMTRKNASFNWNEQCQNSFVELKSALLSPRILQYPEFTKQFLITVDASRLGCGAILSQDFNGNDLPIYYASKSFTQSEQKKPIIELELLAIHFAITQFRPYVYGTTFTVRSDHRPLVYLFNIKDPSSKLTRIRLELSEYNFTVEYIKGKNNVGADALSRVSINELKNRNDQILAMTTRSKSKVINNNKIDLAESFQEVNNFKLRIYDKFSHDFNKNVPKIKTEIINIDEQVKLLRINLYRKFKKLLNVEFEIVNETTSLDYLLSRLQSIANNHQIYVAEWPKNDLFFTLFTIRELKDYGNKVLKNFEIILTEPIETVTEEQDKEKLMRIYHNDPILGGHCGQKKLYAKIRTKYYWKKMTRDIAKFVKNCPKCNLNKVKPSNVEKLVLTPTPTKAFDIVVLDTIGPLPQSNYGNKYALTLMCDLSKYLITIAIPDKSAQTVARAIFENFILVYGKMGTIKSDLGTEFKNEIVRELCKFLKIELKFSTSYHHQTLGTVERNHRVFNEYIRAYIGENISDWDTYLKYFTFYHNTSSNTVFDNKFTPFELVFGKKVTMPNETNTNLDPIYNIDNYSQEIKYRLQKTNVLAKQLIDKHKERNKAFYDRLAKPIELQINDTVVLQKEPYDKYKSIYTGPYIVSKIDGANITIYNEITKKEKTVHKNRIRKS